MFKTGENKLGLVNEGKKFKKLVKELYHFLIFFHVSHRTIQFPF